MKKLLLRLEHVMQATYYYFPQVNNKSEVIKNWIINNDNYYYSDLNNKSE